jgi:sulfite exporter TauE/SafE
MNDPASIPLAALLPTLGAVLVASVLGSLHCAGMCGGLVLFAVGADGKPRKRTPLHVAYHAGRGLAYTTLGLAAGLIGAATDIAATINANTRTSAIVAGVLMVALGLVALAQNTGVRGLNAKLPKSMQRAAEAAHRRAFMLPPLHRAAAVGLLTPLLPCGWLYAFVIVAAGTGSPLIGALVMGSFWAGTLPLMSALGLGLQALTGPLRDRLPAATALIVVTLGVLTATGRVGLPTAIATELPDGTLSEQVRAAASLSHNDLPCCNPNAVPEPAEP